MGKNCLPDTVLRGRKNSLADLHAAWALHRQTLDDDEVAAVHEAYRGVAAPHASHFPNQQGQRNQHSTQWALEFMRFSVLTSTSVDNPRVHRES